MRAAHRVGASGSGGGAAGGGRASGWGTSQRIDEGVTGGSAPAAAVSNTGDAFIAFAGNEGIWVRRYTKASDTLAPPALIDVTTGLPRIAADDAGGALLVMQTGQYEIAARRFEAGSPWPAGWGGRQVVQATEGGAFAGGPLVQHELGDLAMTPSGHAVIAWNRWGANASGDIAESFLSLYDAGRGWGAARRFSTNGAYSENARLSIVEINQSLKICAAMTVYEAARDATDVWVNDMTYDLATGAGVVGAPKLQHRASGTLLSFPQAVASDAAGNFSIAIHERDAFRNKGTSWWRLRSMEPGQPRSSWDGNPRH